MILSITKCNHACLTRKTHPVSFKRIISGMSLPTVSEVKYLGVYFTKHLSWAKHVDYTTPKPTRMVNFIRRNFKDCPKLTKRTLYPSYIRAIVEYACFSWGCHQAYLVDKLEAVQNKAAGFISGNHNFVSSETQLKIRLDVIPLSQRRWSMWSKFDHSTFNNYFGIDKYKYMLPANYSLGRHDHSERVQEYKCRADV